MYYPREDFQFKTDSNFRHLFELLEVQNRFLELLTNEIISLNRAVQKPKIKIKKFKKLFKKSKQK